MHLDEPWRLCLVVLEVDGLLTPAFGSRSPGKGPTPMLLKARTQSGLRQNVLIEVVLDIVEVRCGRGEDWKEGRFTPPAQPQPKEGAPIRTRRMRIR
jgi:hypothetical protein